MKHISVLLDECINGLNIKENGIFILVTDKDKVYVNNNLQ